MRSTTTASIPRARRVRRAVVAAVSAGLLLAGPALAETVVAAIDGRDAHGFAGGGAAAGDAGSRLAQAWSTTLAEHRFGPTAAGRPGEVAGRAVVTRRGLALVAAERADGHGVELVALDAATGRVRWSVDEPLAPGCMPLEARDGRIWALVRAPNSWQVANHALVAVDRRSGAIDVEDQGILGRWGQRELLGCHGAIEELPDGRLVWLQPLGDGASLRVTHPDQQDSDRRDTFEHTLELPGRTVGQAWSLLPRSVDGDRVAVVTSHDGSSTRLHVVRLPETVRNRWVPSPADVLHTVDLPGGPVAATGLVVVGDAVLVAAGPHAGQPGHVTRLDGDPDALSVTWRSDGPTDALGASRPFDPRWLTVGGGTLVARDGADLVGIDPRDGGVEWAWSSAGSQHLTADASGDVLSVAGGEVVGVTPAGARQDGGRLPSGIDHARAVEVLGVDDAGRVLVMASDGDGAARVVAFQPSSGAPEPIAPVDDDEPGDDRPGRDEPVGPTPGDPTPGDDDPWAPVPGAPTVHRHVGAGRVATAVEVAARAFDRADVAVLARADAYPDALAGGPLAAALDGPLLLSDRAGLAPVVRDELRRLGVDRVVLLGGEAALSRDVERALRDDLSLDVERISGRDRWSTAAAVAERIGGDEAYLVEGMNADPNRGWPDAVAVSGVASARGVPILLAARDALPQPTVRALVGRDVTIVGGRAAIGDAVALAAGADARVSGRDRWSTSLAVVEHGMAVGVDIRTLWVATGTAYPDALSAGAAAAATDGSLVLVHGTNVGATAASRAFLAEHGTRVQRLELVGGERAVSRDVEQALVAAREGQP